MGKATLFKVVEGKLFGLSEPASIRRVRPEGQDNSAENLELGHRQSFMSRSLNCIQPEAKLSKTCKRQQLLSGAYVRDFRSSVCYDIWVFSPIWWRCLGATLQNGHVHTASTVVPSSVAVETEVRGDGLLCLASPRRSHASRGDLDFRLFACCVQ